MRIHVLKKMQDKNSHAFLSEWRRTRPRERSEPEDGEGGSCHSRCWCFGVEPSRCLTMIDRSVDRQVGWMIRTKMGTKSNKTNNCICVCTNRLLLVVLLASECMFFLTILYWNTSYIARTLKIHTSGVYIFRPCCTRTRTLSVNSTTRK